MTVEEFKDAANELGVHCYYDGDSYNMTLDNLETTSYNHIAAMFFPNSSYTKVYVYGMPTAGSFLTQQISCGGAFYDAKYNSKTELMNYVADAIDKYKFLKKEFRKKIIEEL